MEKKGGKNTQHIKHVWTWNIRLTMKYKLSIFYTHVKDNPKFHWMKNQLSTGMNEEDGVRSAAGGATAGKKSELEQNDLCLGKKA